MGCESWRGDGILVGIVSWLVLEGAGGRGDVMTVPKGANEEGVSGRKGITRGGACDRVGSDIVE